MTTCNVTVFGLKTCDSCRKTMRDLNAAGYTVALHDVRATPVDPAVLAEWLAVFGEALVNTRSTTWRGLDATERARPPLELLIAHPTLMKRPVILAAGGLHLGWGAAVQKAVLQTD